MDTARLMDFSRFGLGDAVLGCWILNSAHQQGEEVFMNPGSFWSMVHLFDLPKDRLTGQHRSSGSASIPQKGIDTELEHGHTRKRTRFEIWSEALGITGLKPQRPAYIPNQASEEWARQEWAQVGNKPAPRIVILPEASRKTRIWPLIYWIDLARKLNEEFNCCIMVVNPDIGHQFGMYSFWRQPMENFAAVMNQADLVIGSDSGGSHLAGMLGKQVITLQGPTIGEVVFGHDQCISSVHISRRKLGCVACNFRQEGGYSDICENGCQALYLLSPKAVLKVIRKKIETVAAANQIHANAKSNRS
jgi:hypothetical protein